MWLESIKSDTFFTIPYHFSKLIYTICFYNAALGFLTGIFVTITYNFFFTPPLCPKTLHFVLNQPSSKIERYAFFGINYIFEIKYSIKKVKQNVQFMHAVVQLSDITLQKYSKQEKSPHSVSHINILGMKNTLELGTERKKQCSQKDSHRFVFFDKHCY